MKALDILIYILQCGGMIHVDRGFMSNVSKAVEELKEHLSDKDDQIKWLREELKYHKAELEALQQPKSCYDCKHWFPNKASYPCNQCSMAINCLFEPKEQ